MPINDVPREVRKILDCKLPGSGMERFNCYENYTLLQPHDEVKFVVSSREDFDFACDVVRKYDLPSKTANLLVSPVWGKADFEDLAQWVISSRLPLRMQLQMHKIIWGNKPGV
jgi:7-carboxy-7-deazaguanine synthase